MTNAPQPPVEAQACLILYRALYQRVKDGGAEALLGANEALNALQVIHTVLFGGPMQVITGKKTNESSDS